MLNKTESKKTETEANRKLNRRKQPTNRTTIAAALNPLE